MDKIEQLPLKNIFVPIDFSEYSKTAFRYASLFAKAYKAKIYVYHHFLSHMEDLPVYAEGFVKELQTNPKHALKSLAEESMQNFLAEQDTAGLEVESMVHSTMPLMKDILKEVDQKQIDLVITGTHARKGVDRWSWGSMTEHMIHQVPCPILSFHHGEKEIEGKDLSQIFKRMMLATDLSETAHHAVMYGLRLGKWLNCEIDLTHVIDFHYWGGDYTFNNQVLLEEMRKEMAEHARDKMKIYLESITDAKEFFRTHVFHGHPVKSLLQACEDQKSNLLVLGNHGHHRISSLFLGRTADRILREAPCPVLIVK